MNEKSKQQLLQKPIIVCLGAMICCILWGSAFPSIKIGYELYKISSDDIASQLLFAGLRFLLGGILTILISSALSRQFLIPKRDSYSKIVTLGMFQTVAQYIFFYVGLANTTGVKASIIQGVNVFITLLIASFVFHQEKLSTKKMIGSLIGFSGVILINLSGQSLSGGFSLLGEGFIFLSSVAYAISSSLTKRYSASENPLILSGYQFFIGGIILTTLGLLFGGQITVITGSGIGILLYLASVSAISYSLWGILLKYNPVSKVAVYGFMNPVFGVMTSAIFLNEAGILNPTGILSLFLVCFGIYVVNKE